MTTFALKIPMVSAAVLSLLAVQATCFLPSQQQQQRSSFAHTSRTGWTATYMAETEASDTTTTTAAATTPTPPKNKSRTPSSVPNTWADMVRQAANAMKQAEANGQKRQIVRLLLPRDANANDFGKAVEATIKDNMDAAVLVPPDESWQGGIMQLYRAAAPTCEAILRQYSSMKDDGVGLPPRVNEDRSVDESGVDGVGLLSTDTVSVWLQPTQENVEAICERTTRKENENDMVVVMNPQWRLVDDALDTASKGETGFFSALAAYLGGKGDSLAQLADTGFKPVYSLEGYICRGSNVRLLQVNDSDWAVFCERDDGMSYISVGSAPTRPNYQQVEAMLNDSDIGPKYARDMGFSKKL
jgi:hypothetical protein